jgi:hypothetical protein
MNTKNMFPKITGAGDGGKCPETLRYYVLLYVDLKDTDFFVNVSVKDIDIQTLEVDDLAIEFLTYKEMNCFDYPYDAELFGEIEVIAKEFLKEIKEEEPKVISGAV